MNIAVVVQRFGKEVIGGAEAHARSIINRLTNDLNWQIKVYTTTAKSYSSWAPHFNPGISTEDGIEIHRFNVDRRRSIFFRFYHKLYTLFFHFPFPKLVRNYLESLWMQFQGPCSSELEQQIINDQSRYDFILFFTYLYPTTNHILPKISVPTILVPTAHDELAFYFATTKKLLVSATHIYANTTVEKNLIVNTYPEVREKTKVVGLGFDEKHVSIPSSLPTSTPYLFYLGRIGRAKNAHLLIKYFEDFLDQHPQSDLKLILAGEQDDGFHIRQSKSISVLGYISESEKFSLISNATALVSASYHESLAMIVLEAVATKTPVLVASQCPLFLEYSKTIPSVTPFRDSFEFCSAVAEIRAKTDPKQAEMLEKSRKWLEEHLSWHKVLSIYKSLEHDFSKQGELN